MQDWIKINLKICSVTLQQTPEKTKLDKSAYIKSSPSVPPEHGDIETRDVIELSRNKEIDKRSPSLASRARRATWPQEMTHSVFHSPTKVKYKNSGSSK